MTWRSCLRSPLLWILLIAGGLRLAGLFWGTPASDGWDDDGFAPRNFLTALALTYKPGAYFTYPPLHALLLALLTWPAVAAALLHTPSFAQADVVREFTQIPYMTFFAIVARLVSAAMSLGILCCIAQMTALVAGRRAGIIAAAACGLNVALTYYSQVSNLDVPYLFWSLLSLLHVMQAIARHETRKFWPAAMFAAAAIATKDQAYAIFLASVPALALLWFAADPWPRHHWRQVLRSLLLASCVAIVALLLVDGAITNPSGFMKRIAFLAGPASRDYAIYQHSLSGRFRLLQDMAAYYAQGLGLLASLLAVSGMAIQVSRWRDGKALWVAGLLPVLAIVSFTVCFNLAALRTDDRFLLPQAILATIYIAIAIDRAAFSSTGWLKNAVRAGLAVAGLCAFYQCAAIDAAMLRDPRYDAERWMRAHLRPGDTIETYGQNAYLPRFPKDMVVTRVGPTPLNRRNPLPGVMELRQPFQSIAARNPKFIVVSAWWMQNYLGASAPPQTGRAIAGVRQQRLQDRDAGQFLASLERGTTNYRLAHESRYDGRYWPPIHIHESLCETVRIFQRVSAP